MSYINLVNGLAHRESHVAQLVRAPNRYLGGHGFDSRRGLRFFLCPTLVSCRIISLLLQLTVIYLKSGTGDYKTHLDVCTVDVPADLTLTFSVTSNILPAVIQSLNPVEQDQAQII